MSAPECPCPRPWPSAKDVETCRACGLWINPAWSSSDQSVKAFYDALERTVPSWPTVPQWLKDFRLHAEARERAGRPIFGQAALSRDNVADGHEEAADGANYAMYETLVAIRSGNDVELDLALSAAKHFAEAYNDLTKLREKERGRPDGSADFDRYYREKTDARD